MATKDTKRFIRLDVDDQTWRTFKDKLRSRGSSITQEFRDLVDDVVASAEPKRNEVWQGLRPGVGTDLEDEQLLAMQEAQQPESGSVTVTPEPIAVTYSDPNVPAAVNTVTADPVGAVALQDYINAQIALAIARATGAAAAVKENPVTNPEMKLEDIPTAQRPMGGVGCSLCSCEDFRMKEGAPSRCDDCGHFRVQHYGN